MGGSLGEMHAKKITHVMDLALKTGAPLIGINDLARPYSRRSRRSVRLWSDFYRNTIASGVIPQISVIMDLVPVVLYIHRP